MKHKLVISFFILTILLVTACGSRKEAARDAVEHALTAIQKQDEVVIEKYFGDKLDEELQEDETEGISFDDMMPLFLKHMTYQIVDAKESDQNATVKVDISNINMQKIMSEYLSQYMTYVLPYAFVPENEQPSDDEMEAKLKEILTTLINDHSRDKITKSVDIALIYTNEQWQIEMTDQLGDAIFGGLISFLNTMDQTSEQIDIEDRIFEIRNWLVSDIWNDGINNISSYLYKGTDSIGETMDINVALEQLDKAMEKKITNDQFMNSLSQEYSEVKETWGSISEQVDLLYKQIKESGLTPTGAQLDTALYNQAFEAFEKALTKLD